MKMPTDTAKDDSIDAIPFEFLDYNFDKETYRATFRYRGGTAKNPLIFVKKVQFLKRATNSSKKASKNADKNSPAKNAPSFDEKTLDRALFLSFIINGTSYYKAFPTREVILPQKIDEAQAYFFDTIYQDGLSQFAYENHLTREDLAHFKAGAKGDSLVVYENTSRHPISDLLDSTGKWNRKFTARNSIIALQSGGKDSLLTASFLTERRLPWTALYVSTSGAYPEIIDEVGAKDVYVINRDIDLRNLKKAEALGGKNGHVPVTYINISLAIIQAILDGKDTILTSIGFEGEEPHSIIESGRPGIEDLLVNHQWSKTGFAEVLLQGYIMDYVSPKIRVFSPLRNFREIEIAGLFVDSCWHKFGHKFSSCNVANYGQKHDNSELKWCGRCAKCANTYLLFAPFLNPEELNSLFPNNQSLFEVKELEDTFKGLLGVERHLKPFECVGDVEELRLAYYLKKPDYPELPFNVPKPLQKPKH